MLSEKDKFFVERLLRNDNSYSVKQEIDKNEEIRNFIIGLFELTDDFDIKKQLDRDEDRIRLNNVKEYALSVLGNNSKFIEDINVAIRNLDAEYVQDTSYYDDLNKLRAAISWDK